MNTILALLAAGVLVAWIARRIRRAARRLDGIQRETAAADFTTHCDELLAIVHDTQPGRNETARLLLEDMWRQDVATRRNTGPRPRKEEL